MTTFDKLSVLLSSRDEAEDFISIWDSVFEEQFYFEYFENNGFFSIDVDVECLFRSYESGSRIDRVVLDCMKKHPSCTLYLEYTNGDGIALKYSYEDGKLQRTMICDNEGYERDGIDYCNKCEHLLEPPIFTLLTYDSDKEYCCPSCGADLLEQFKPTVETTEIILRNNEWVLHR